MNTPTDDRPDAVAGQVQRSVRPDPEARWYCLSREGMATLCVDEEDAKEVAAESWVLYPNNGPYRVAQMVDRQQPLTRQQIDDVMTQHYPLSSLLREEVDAFEACVRDIERLHGIGA